MAWSVDAKRQMHRALKAHDLTEFVRLLDEYPENLREENGGEFWLDRSAANNLLPFVEVLVSRGIGVNEPNNLSEPAGAIVQAAEKGHAEVVRWFLDHGAQLNFTVNGKATCPPLLAAAAEGHLEVVRLLVEHGADVAAAPGGVNALMFARMGGHKEVAEYLAAIGSRDVRDTTPPDYPASHQRLEKIVVAQRGPLASFARTVPGDPPIAIRATQATEPEPSQTLFTLGLSDRDLTVPGVVRVATELMVFLPGDWPLTDAVLADPRWNWPVEWLQRIAREALDAGTWPGVDAALFLNGDPLGPGTALCGWLAVTQEAGQHQMPDHRWVDLRTLFAIHADEADLVRREGHVALLRRFEARGFPLWIDPQRPSVAGDPDPQ